MAERYGRQAMNRRSRDYEPPEKQTFECGQNSNQNNNNKDDNDDDDDDDELVVDEEEEEEELEEDEKLLQMELANEAETDDVSLIESTDNIDGRLGLNLVPSSIGDPDDLVAQMLANMAARFKNFEDILADLRLQVSEVARRDEEIVRRMRTLNEEISEMQLLENVLATSGGLQNVPSLSSPPLQNSNEADAYGDLHMTDFGAHVHLSSHLTSAKIDAGARPYIK